MAVKLNDYKILVTHTKILPIVLAFFHLLNCVLAYFNFDSIALNYVAGISILPIIYLYHSSFVFKLCNYYRMFLHYCIVINVINVYDFYIGIPISNLQLLELVVSITILTMFMIIYMKFFSKCKKS